MSKLSLEDIRAELQSEGWDVISTVYNNLDTEMQFVCPEGHTVTTSWKKLRAKRECPTCIDKHQYKFSVDAKIIPKKGKNRILALDQATHTTGYAIIDDTELIYAGTFEVNDEDETDRIVKIKNWFLNMLNNWKPDYIGIEGIQFQEEDNGRKMGVTVFQTLARLQGTLMVVCREQGIPFEICPTNTWRHYCGVKGRTRTDKKRSMQLLIKEWYDKSVSDDIADAVGIGKYTADHLKRNVEIVSWE